MSLYGLFQHRNSSTENELLREADTMLHRRRVQNDFVVTDVFDIEIVKVYPGDRVLTDGLFLYSTDYIRSSQTIRGVLAST